MDDLKNRMKEWWEYDPGHIIPQALARIEALEARVAAADKLAEALTHEREMVCQDFGMQQDAATAVHNALAAYVATKEQSE